MTAQLLWILGSSIFLVLGLLHLRITFFGKKLYPKQEDVEAGMKNTHLRITKDTTLWKAWIGFNASHSAGAIFFGAVNIILAGQFISILVNSYLLMFLTLAFSGFFLYLGKKYWFKIPFIGILISTLCFMCSILLILFNLI